MTDYNERLDEILALLNARIPQPKTINEATARATMCHEAKQAITSLTKELVAEAKPGTWVDHEDTDDLEWRGYVSGVSDFEHNLLKGLELYDRS